MKLKLLATVLSLGAVIYACTPESLVTEPELTTLNVPTTFDWRTAKDVQFSVDVSDLRFSNALHVISVYAEDPSTGVLPLAKGAAAINSPFSALVSLPTVLKEIFIVKTAPDGTKITEKVNVESTNNVEISIGSTPSGRFAATETYLQTNAVVVPETSPNCDSGCDVKIDEKSDKNVTLDSKTVCLTGSNYAVNINSNNLKGGTLRICGTNITVNNLNLQNNATFTVIVTSTGSANFSNLNWDSPNVTFKNFGTLTFSGNFIVGGTFTNYGTVNANSELQTRSTAVIQNEGKMIIKGNAPLQGKVTTNGTFTVGGELNLNSSSTSLVNGGTVSVSSNFNINDKGSFTNTGTATFAKDLQLNSSNTTIDNSNSMTVTGKMTVNSSTTFNNSGSCTVNELQINSNGIVNNKCKLIVKTILGVDNILNNYNFVSVGNYTRINSSGKVNLFDGAYLLTNILNTFDGKITGTGTNYSLFKVVNPASDNINNGSGTKVTGTVQFAEPSGKLKASFFDKDAKSTKDGGIYIPKTECNDGNGTAPVVIKDADSDGIVDAEDSYPNDPTKAFDSYSTPSTAAFEDQWPSTGDYDLNDVVLTYKYQIVTNATNKVVQIKGNYILQAAGGALQNGAGVQFNLPSGSAKNFSSTTGASIEAGHDSLVVVLFQNSGKELGAWNTIPTEKAVATKAYSFSVDIANGPLLKTLGVGSYNLFIWNNSAGRGRETHLKGKVPTKLADTKLFGTQADASLKVKYYSTLTGFPWGIEVSTDSFKYPAEYKSIKSAYLKFADWVTSGGTLYKDWYSNTASGYRNNTNIYKP